MASEQFCNKCSFRKQWSKVRHFVRCFYCNVVELDCKQAFSHSLHSTSLSLQIMQVITGKLKLHFFPLITSRCYEFLMGLPHRHFTFWHVVAFRMTHKLLVTQRNTTFGEIACMHCCCAGFFFSRSYLASLCLFFRLRNSILTVKCI